ncbi:hypothetical protein [Buchnera aphidicola]|uniref:Uncharacterized protein n=1 Tax=Buchnera aphidicola (Anoecia oenotherae) TaxID=1241833 RepID=A0A4D6XYJ7_9GAMM|nr:hypothetical protein [Buchnera aphidicola]QCI19564.1 hypothetical protein D9V65_02355 [Buchnera aphidicola (Anoecia oenotherae)]
MSNIELVNSNSSTIKNDIQENNLTTLIKNLNNSNNDINDGKNLNATSVILYDPTTSEGEYISSDNNGVNQDSDSSRIERVDNVDNNKFIAIDNLNFFSFSSLIPKLFFSNNSAELKDTDKNFFTRMFGSLPMMGVTVDLGSIDSDKPEEDAIFSKNIDYSKLNSTVANVSKDVVETVNEKIIPIFHRFKHVKNKVCDFLGIDYEGQQVEKECYNNYGMPISSVSVGKNDNERLITPDKNFPYIERVNPLLNSQTNINWAYLSKDIAFLETKDVKNELEDEFKEIKNSNNLSNNFTNKFKKSEYVWNDSLLQNQSLDQFMRDFKEKIPDLEDQKIFSVLASKKLFEVPHEFIRENYPQVHSYENQDPIYRYEFIKSENNEHQVIATKIIQSNKLEKQGSSEKNMFGVRTIVTFDRNRISDIEYQILVQ